MKSAVSISLNYNLYDKNNYYYEKIPPSTTVPVRNAANFSDFFARKLSKQVWD
jgi:hypothetical protein